MAPVVIHEEIDTHPCAKCRLLFVMPAGQTCQSCIFEALNGQCYSKKGKGQACDNPAHVRLNAGLVRSALAGDVAACVRFIAQGACDFDRLLRAARERENDELVALAQSQGARNYLMRSRLQLPIKDKETMQVRLLAARKLCQVVAQPLPPQDDEEEYAQAVHDRSEALRTLWNSEFNSEVIRLIETGWLTPNPNYVDRPRCPCPHCEN